MKQILILSIFLLMSAALKAENDTIIIRHDDDSAEKISRDLDSLLNTWYVNIALRNTPLEFSEDPTVLEYPDSVYIDRLSKINYFIELPYNNIIRNHIHVYTVRQRDRFGAVLGLVDYYFPMFEDIFPTPYISTV